MSRFREEISYKELGDMGTWGRVRTDEFGMDSAEGGTVRDSGEQSNLI